MQPNISVIIPVYNVLAYLTECVESVLAQNYSNCEIVLVDDGSTDGSQYLCDRLAQNNSCIHVIHTTNKGLSSARNTGIRAASGEYCMFLDSDDSIINGCLGDISVLIEQSQPDVVVGMFMPNTEENAVPLYDIVLNAEAINNNSKASFLNYVRTSGMTFVAWRYIVKKKILDTQGLYFYEGIYHEDEEWTPRLLCCADTFIAYEKPFYRYRIRASGSIMSSIGLQHFRDKIRIIDSLHSFVGQVESREERLFLECKIFKLIVDVVRSYKMFDHDNMLQTMLYERQNILQKYTYRESLLLVLCTLLGALRGFLLFVFLWKLKKKMQNFIFSYGDSNAYR